MEFVYKDLDDSHCGFSLQIRAFLNFYESSYHELWVLFTTKEKKKKRNIARAVCLLGFLHEHFLLVLAFWTSSSS